MRKVLFFLYGLVAYAAFLASFLYAIPFVVLVSRAAAREQAPGSVVWSIIAMNGAWVIASVALLLSGLVAPTVWGYAFVIAQTVIVGAFAELQIIGVRKAAPVAG